MQIFKMYQQHCIHIIT